MTTKPKKSFSETWFFRWILDNKGVTAVIITLLTFLMILIFTQIAPLLAPVVEFLGIIMLPLVISGLAYYLLKPFVDFLERKGLGKGMSITIVFVVIIALLIWAMSGFIPMMVRQLTSFVKDLPVYVAKGNEEVDRFMSQPFLRNYQGELDIALSNVGQKAMTYAESVSKNAISWVSHFAGTFARVTVAIIISPFILFYLLKDGNKVKGGILNVTPTAMRPVLSRILSDIDGQVAGYVQGQVFVAIAVGIMFSVMYGIVGLRYGITLGILAGALNVIPYLGSFVAQIPVFILALVAGPMMVVKVAIIFVIEQTIEGRFISPLVLGAKLNIHPITILLILLSAGSMFGVWGVFLGIPVYASVKVVVKELFDWYKTVSNLYDETPMVIESEETEVNAK